MGELGCSSRTPKVHAEVMKRPRAAASMQYSRQCARRADKAAHGCDVRVSVVMVCITGRFACRFPNDPGSRAYSRRLFFRSGINMRVRWISIGDMQARAQNTTTAMAELLSTNVTWLKQALSLVQQVDDVRFISSPPGLAPHRVGSHLRHVLEFYECFLDGLRSGHLNYD